MGDIQGAKSPYTWPGALGLHDSELLFGRERESRLTAASAMTKPLTVIYGGGGTGKTSLLQAGVAAQLNARRDALAVVFDRWTGGDPSRALREAVAAVALALPPDETTPAVLAWRERLRDDTALDVMLGDLAGASRRSVVLILDHFEEYLRLHPEADALSHELPAAIRRPQVSAVVAVAEHAFALLDRFEGDVPGLYDNFRRVDHLTAEAARLAVVGPAARYNEGLHARAKITIEPRLTEAVVTQLAERHRLLSLNRRRDDTPRVRAGDVQALMSHLWRLEAEAASRTLRLSTLEQAGGAAAIAEARQSEVSKARNPRVGLMLDLVLASDPERAAERIKAHLMRGGYLDERGEPTPKAWGRRS